MPTPAFLPLPVDDGWLTAYRLRARQLGRTAGSGAHIIRRLGQSLEFRELAPYNLGDDIRHVDVGASLRAKATPYRNPLGEWMTRRFVAEEHYKLVISLDNRPTMLWPQTLRRGPIGLPKLQVARWIAAAASLIALDFGDRVALHGLFGSTTGLREFRRADRMELEAAIADVSNPDAATDSVQLDALDDALPPATVWIVLTDLYANPPELQRLESRMRDARSGRRTVFLLELDAWPFEQAVLGRGARRIEFPGMPQRRVHVDTTALQRVDQEIAARRAVFDAFGGGTRWAWPGHFADADAPTRFFSDHFASDPALLSVFMRDA